MSGSMLSMPDSPQGTRSRGPAAIVGMLTIAILAACASGDDNATATTLPAVTTAPTTAPEAETTLTQPAPDVTQPATTPPATPPATVAVTGSTVTEPTAATTLPPTTTTEPLAVQELLLTGEGLGSAVFGADPDGVIEYVTSILGGNTADTGWVDPYSFAACEGTIARRVDWGVLSLLFTDLSPIANGRRHFIGYEYGLFGQIGDEPVGLRTPGGITLGSRVVDLLAEFPEATVNAGEPEVGIPDNFYVSSVFWGLLTGATPDDYVTVLFGGYGCFE